MNVAKNLTTLYKEIELAKDSGLIHSVIYQRGLNDFDANFINGKIKKEVQLISLEFKIDISTDRIHQVCEHVKTQYKNCVETVRMVTPHRMHIYAHKEKVD